MDFEIHMAPDEDEEWGATPEQVEELRAEFIRVTKAWIKRIRAAQATIN
jgi:hypothetical protein